MKYYTPIIDNLKNNIKRNLNDTLSFEELDTISNIELVKDKGCVAYTHPGNSRDVFLTSSFKQKYNVRPYHIHYTETIIHEVTHNILTKHIDEKSSEQLDNLFNRKRNRRKIKINLFGMKKGQTRDRQYPEFWLWKMNV